MSPGSLVSAFPLSRCSLLIQKMIRGGAQQPRDSGQTTFPEAESQGLEAKGREQEMEPGLPG